MFGKTQECFEGIGTHGLGHPPPVALAAGVGDGEFGTKYVRMCDVYLP